MKLINKIHFGNLQGDLFGGLTAAIVALPMALAFGVASGAGAIAGLYCAVFLGFFGNGGQRSSWGKDYYLKLFFGNNTLREITTFKWL